MLRLHEDTTKAWLASRGIGMPRGAVAYTAAEAVQIADAYASGAIVKALVRAGRRGKAGAVITTRSASETADAVVRLLDREIAGERVAAVYVEEWLAIHDELFLSFSIDETGLHALASARGGVDVEQLATHHPDALIRRDLDPLRGLAPWDAIELWRACGVRGTILRSLASLTTQLYAAFVAADATLLELNPIAITGPDHARVVGAMMAIDTQALFRQGAWQHLASQEIEESANPREQAVMQANAALPGGEAQYNELDGDIGLLVGGGGAGLYVHDLILALGGRPANHCVTPPTGQDTRKLKAVLNAILDNPRTRGLLVAFNFAQMARVDLRMQALAEVIEARGLDTTRFPIVLRLFGAGEADARARAARFPGVTYLPRGTSLKQAAERIVAAVR